MDIRSRQWTTSKKDGAKVGEGPRWGMMIVMEESHERSTKTVIIWSRNLVHKIIDKGERDGICDETHVFRLSNKKLPDNNIWSNLYPRFFFLFKFCSSMRMTVV